MRKCSRVRLIQKRHLWASTYYLHLLAIPENGLYGKPGQKLCNRHRETWSYPMWIHLLNQQHPSQAPPPYVPAAYFMQLCSAWAHKIKYNMRNVKLCDKDRNALPSPITLAKHIGGRGGEPKTQKRQTICTDAYHILKSCLALQDSQHVQNTSQLCRAHRGGTLKNVRNDPSVAMWLRIMQT